MRRRAFITLLGSAAVAWPLAARAQQPHEIRRIGVLIGSAGDPDDTDVQVRLGAFRTALQQLGWIEGVNVRIEFRPGAGDADRIRRLATELVALAPDVILASGTATVGALHQATRRTPAVLAAKNATATVPVVMAAMGDPLMVVSSLSRPGGNVTGLSGYSTDLEAKRFELLKEMMPSAARIAGLYNMGNAVTPPQWSELQRAAKNLRVQSQLLDVRRTEDIAPAFDAAIREHADGLMVGVDALTQANRQMIADLALKHRLPTIYVSREFIEAGGLIAYGPSYPELYRRAATYIDKIFKGEKAGDLPIEQPTKFELIINLKTAKALRLEIPPTLLARADEVIE